METKGYKTPRPDSKQEPIRPIPKAVDSDTLSDTEPKTYETVNTAIQGVFGLFPGDPDPSYKIRFSNRRKPYLLH